MATIDELYQKYKSGQGAGAKAPASTTPRQQKVDTSAIDQLYQRWRQQDYEKNKEQYESSVQERLADLTSRQSSFSDAYTSRYQNRNDSTYVSDYDDWYQRVAQEKESYEADVESFLEEFAKYEEFYDQDTVNSIRSGLFSGKQGYAQALSGAQSDRDYFSQWETEEDFQTYLTEQKAYEEKKNLNIDAAQKEIQELERIYAEYDILNRTMVDEQGEARLEELRNQYGYTYDLKDLISEKKAYLNQAKHIQEGITLSTVSGNDDFKKYSGYVSTESDDFAVGLTSQYGLGYEDLTYEYINNQNGIRDEIKHKHTVYGGGFGETTYEEKGYDHMTEDEVAIYNYYYAKDGKEKAQEYLDSIQETLNYRKATEMYTPMENQTLMELAFGVAAGLDQFESGARNLFNTKDDYIPASATQMASGMVREDLGDVGPNLPKWLGGGSLGQMGYDTITTTANMAPSIMTSMAVGLLNPVAGQITGTALMGASAAGNAYQEMLNLGYDKGQARVYSALVGGSEAGLQYLLGGIGKLGGKVSGEVITKMMNGVDNAFLRTAIKLGGNMLSEGVEEGLQEILTPMFQNLVLHTDENVDFAEVAYSTLLGALTAGFMEGGSTIKGEVDTYNTGKNLQAEGITAQRLAEIGSTFSADTVAYQLAGRVDENTGAYTIGRLFNEIGATLTEQNVNDITEALVKKGVPRDIARENAEAMAIVVEGGNLTDRQVQVIEANEPLAEAVITTIIDSNATWFQRTKGYNEALMALAQEKVSSDASRTNPASQSKESGSAEGNLTTDAESGTQGISEALEVDTSPAVAKSFTSIKNGQATIKLEDDTEISAKDAELDPDDGVRIETIASIDGISVSDANYILNTLRSNTGASAQMDALGAKEAYKYGLYGFSKDHMTKHGVFANSLTEAQRQAIYEAGQKARAQQVEATTPKKGTGTTKETGIYFDNGNGNVVAFKDAKKTLTDKQSAGVKAATVLQKLGIGGDIYFFESYLNSKGQRVYKDKNGKEVKAPNGWYSRDGSIHIDLNAGNQGGGFVLFTLSHELTHFIEQWSPQKYKVLADFLVENYEKGQSMDKLVRAKQAKLSANRGTKVSYKEAYSEVVADSMEAMLADGNVMDKLLELKAKDNSLFMKMKQFFDNLVAKIRNVYKGQIPDSEEGRAVMEMTDAIEKLQQIFADALVDASENFQTAEKNTADDGGVKLQTRSVNGTDVVWIEENILKENKGLPVHQFIANYIAEHIGEVYTIIESGQKVYIGEDLPGEYTQSQYTKAILRNNPSLSRAKNRASANLGEMIEIATNRRWEKTKHPGNKDAKYGMYRYDTSFGFPVKNASGKVTGANIYDAEILIRNSSDGKKYLYDIVSIKKNTAASNWLTQRVTSAASFPAGQKSDVSVNKITQKSNDVNTESAEAVGIDVDIDTESVAPGDQMSERTWTESDYVQEREMAAQEIAKAIGVSEKKALAYIDSVNSIAKMIAEDRTRLDYFSSPNRSSFVGNVEYGGSFDFSTLCKKRRLLTGTFTAIQKALPNTALTANEILDIRNRMKEAGLEVSCGLCYVEGSRANMGQFAKEFLKLYKQYYPDAWQPNMADVNTPEGIEWVRINHPEVYEQYEYFWNHYGTLKPGDKNLFASQQKPKLYQLHTEYKGEILQKFKDEDNIEAKNLNGGIRLQSFSDFEIVHLIDTMQIIMDMSRVGLAGQAYTKVPDFAWALGDTGLKINLSLIAKGVDENGKLIFDDVEGMPIDTAVALRNRYSKNVGTILVAFNDEQLLAAMADDRVDFIIPFHRSQWKKSQYTAMGLPAKTKDYTFMQNEKFIKPQYHEYRGRMVKDKATNYMPNEYWDFSKSGKENAEAYLEMCARNNKRPKFYKLLQNNGDGSYSLKADGSTDGYWKLLIDFKMYDNDGVGSPQMPVKPEFNMDEAQRMLNDYQGGHSNFPVAQGIVDDFVKEYKDSHRDVQYSDRDYIDAVNSGDIETAQKMVDEAAKAAGYTIKAYHGTNAEFTVFDKDRMGKGIDKYGSGFYFANRQEISENYGTRNYPVYLKLKKPIRIRSTQSGGEDLRSVKITKKQAAEILKRHPLMYSEESPLGDFYEQFWETGAKAWMVNDLAGKYTYLGDMENDIFRYYPNEFHEAVRDVTGYDGIEVYLDYERFFEEESDYFYVAWFDNQMKSSEPVVRDDNGNVIPLSERFDESKNDIRYSDRDSEGNSLTKEQSAFFAQSKARDNAGKLLMLYHGTPRAGFTTFDPSKGKMGGNWFTTSRADADTYAGNYKHKLFDPNERDEVRSSVGGNFTLGSWMRFDTEEDRAEFLKQNPNAETIKTDAEYEELLKKADKARDWDEYERLEDEQYKNRKELQKLQRAYDRYEWEHSRDATVGELFETPERFSVFDVLRAWDALDSNNAARDEEYSKEDLIDGLREEHNRLIEDGEDGLRDFPFKARLPVGETGDIVNRSNNRTYAVYVNAINPFEIDAKQRTLHGANLYPVIEKGLKDSSYDSVIVRNARVGAHEEVGDVVIIKDSGQVKLASNKNPTEDPDIRYQDRSDDSVSNRSLLANALEGVAQNQIEAQAMAEYKRVIPLLDQEERKLQRLNEQIKELAFAKGPKDTKAIRDLQFEARQAANRINTFDRQLLRMEASKPLQNVLDREKKLAYQRAEKKGKEALAAYKERAIKTQREITERYQESRKKGIESRHKTAMRHKIKDVVNELNQYLLRGTKDRHVPIELQKAVAEALDAVNMDTVGAEERIAKLKDDLLKAKTPEQIQEISRKIDHIQEMGDRMNGRLKKLKEAYDEFVNSDDPLIANSYDEVISSKLQSIIESVGNTPLRDMTLAQLEDVYDMYRMVLTTIQNANKTFKAKKNESISTLGNRVMEEVERVGGKKKLTMKGMDGVKNFVWNNLKPVYAFAHIGSDTFTEIFDNVRAGEDVWAVDVTEAREYYLTESKKYSYDSWDFEKRYKFTSTSGMTFELSLEQIMSLYAYSKREQAAEHLKKGGIVIDESTEITVKTKLGIPVKFNPTEATAYNISDETLSDIVSKLTKEQKGFVDEMQDYLSTVMGAKGNEVSLAMYGVKLFKEKFYFPLKSAQQFMAKAKEQAQGEVKIKNSGFSKETVQKASNPIVLTPFMNVWSNHVNEMSMYHAFVLPMEDFYRVYNYKTPTSETMATESVEMFIQNAYGKGATKYIDQLLKDLNGGARTDHTTGIINKMMGLFKKGAVFASLSVVVQQPSAIARAAALVDTQYFIGPKVDHKRHKLLWDEVKQYAPVAIIKEMGYFDTNMGKSTQDFILGKEYSGFTEKMSALVKDSNYRDELLSKGPALADEIAWCSIWEAVKREVNDKYPKMDVKSEAFLKKVGERFTEVIVKTQVYDSVLSRSGLMRSKDTGMKMATAFMAEPTTSINMVADALLQGKRGNRKYARTAIGAVIASQILNSILVSFVYAGRDDDEDKTYLEKYIGTLTGEILDSLNPAGYIPFIKDIVSIVQGYDVERSDMAIISDLWNAWQNLSNDNVSAYRKVEGFAGSIAQIFGLPVKNIMRDARGIYQTIMSFVNGQQTTKAGIGYSVKSAIPEWLGGGDVSNQNQLYEAYLSGDDAHLARIVGRYKDESAVNSAMRSAIKGHYTAGDISSETAIAYLVEYAGMEEDDAYWKLQEWEYENNSEDEFAKYNKFYEAVQTGINLNAVIKEYTDNGVTTNTLAAQVTSHFKPQYLEMSTSEKASIKGYLLNAITLLGKTREEAEDLLKEWEFEGEYGFAYDEKKQQFLNGSISAAEMKTIIMSVEGKTAEEASSTIVGYTRDAYEDGYFDRFTASTIMVSYGGLTQIEAEAKLQYIDVKKQFPDTYIDDAWVAEYYSEVESSGISIEVFIDYRNKVKGITGEGKKEGRMAVIDSMPISTAQKDALYYAEGWAASRIYEAPWH